MWELREEGEGGERQVRRKVGREWAQLAIPRSAGPGRARKGSQITPVRRRAAGWPKACWTAGGSSHPAGDSLRSPSWRPGRTTESWTCPRFPTAHPKRTGKSVVFCTFFPSCRRLVSNKLASAGAQNVVWRCARQLSQSHSSRAAAALLQCAKSSRAGIGREPRSLEPKSRCFQFGAAGSRVPVPCAAVRQSRPPPVSRRWRGRNCRKERAHLPARSRTRPLGAPGGSRRLPVLGGQAEEVWESPVPLGLPGLVPRARSRCVGVSATFGAAVPAAELGAAWPERSRSRLRTALLVEERAEGPERRSRTER